MRNMIMNWFVQTLVEDACLSRDSCAPLSEQLDNTHPVGSLLYDYDMRCTNKIWLEAGSLSYVIGQSHP